MAYYKKDYKLAEAKKILEGLDQSRESELIRYLVSIKQERLDLQDKKIKEYRDFFDKLSGFMRF